MTPMMQQYHQAKAACPGALLLFRMGDFYELFYEDAVRAAELLGLALTSRDKGENAVPMAGFPHHQLESYLARLLTAGQRAAVCEQVEDPKQAKGIVRREVTRVVSPGTLTDDTLLEPGEHNYLAAVVPGDPVGLAWVELSTGEFRAASLAPRQLADELARLQPAECLVSDEASWPAELAAAPSCLTARAAWTFSTAAAHKVCTEHFGTASLEGFGFDDADQAAIRAAGGVLEYLRETQRCRLDHLDRLIPYRSGSVLEIDAATRRSLELTRTLRDGRREASLLGAIDRTVTAMGSRLLGDWLAAPLADRSGIEFRQEAIEELLRDGGLLNDLRERLREIHDVERLLARVSTGRATPRDLGHLGRTLGRLPAIKARLTARRSALLGELEGALDLCPDLRARLDAALVETCPLSAKEGGFIREGYHAELDALRELATGGKQWIAQYQAAEQQRTGIATLKVGFNKVFGYYIEITHANQAKVPPEYQRRQTVKNAERYVTPELKQYEERVLTADQKANDLEYELFVALRELIAGMLRPLQRTARVLAQLDVLAGLAHLALDRGYCRPKIVDEPTLELCDARHPVLDICQPPGQFVPNDTRCELEQQRVLLITGPNMAGKSTYIRQTALLVILAQIGSFLPARQATVGLADRIFARVGASDELSRGQSTFMVEMTETARILHTASNRSLVILDEIGRGTSTYDGVSLAWAVVEHLHDRVGCRTLFATHYHELTELAKSLAGIENLNVAVREWQEEVVFLHKIVPGAADKSYGIHVARLAGVPREVVERAKEILWQLEAQHVDGRGRPRLAPPERRAGRLQLTLFDPPEHPLIDQLAQLDLASLTPLAALQLLHQWQAEVARQRTTQPG